MSSRVGKNCRKLMSSAKIGQIRTATYFWNIKMMRAPVHPKNYDHYGLVFKVAPPAKSQLIQNFRRSICTAEFWPNFFSATRNFVWPQRHLKWDHKRFPVKFHLKVVPTRWNFLHHKIASPLRVKNYAQISLCLVAFARRNIIQM